MCSSLSWFVILNQLDLWSVETHNMHGSRCSAPVVVYLCFLPRILFSSDRESEYLCLWLNCCRSWSSDLFYPASENEFVHGLWTGAVVLWVFVAFCHELLLGDWKMLEDTAVELCLNSCSCVLQYVIQITSMKTWI